MVAGETRRPAPRKRNRKRKRRNVSSPSESSSESSDSSSSSESPTRPNKSSGVKVQPAAADSPSDASSSSESSDEDSESDVDTSLAPKASASREQLKSKEVHRDAESPPPQESIPLPPFLPSDSKVREEEEKLLKDRFRKYWMASIADGFANDLNEIRNEPNLTPSRLALLIDALASGTDVYSSSSTGPDGVNEMELVLNK